MKIELYYYNYFIILINIILNFYINISNFFNAEKY